jgi:CheY-like chemotaxis protein
VITHSNLPSDMSEIPRIPDEQQPIVIADADEENALHLERQLRRAGIKNPVVSFQNGDDLNAFLADCGQKNMAAPCVLFLDPRMPGANGYDPVRWVKREKGGDEILVAVFTSGDQADEVESGNELGVQIFLKKRPDLHSLSVVVAHLGGTPVPEPAAATLTSTPELPIAPVS